MLNPRSAQIISCYVLYFGLLGREATLRDPRAQRRRTHPRGHGAVIPVVTVALLQARAVVFLLHQPVVDPFPRQTGIDDKTVAWNKEARY